MKYLRNFFHIFGSSLFPTDKYYQKIPEHSLGFSLKYFFTLVILITFFANMATYGIFYPEKKVNNIKMGVDELLNSFPKDFKLSIKNGTLTTNFERPYRFWWAGIANPIIVIDEAANLQELADYKSLLAFNKNNMLGKNVKNGKYEVTPINVKTSLDVNYSMVQEAKKTVGDVYKLMPFLWVILVFIIYMILPVVLTAIKITYLLFGTLLVYVIFKLINNKLEFLKTFQLALHAATVPTVLGALVMLSVDNIPLQGLFFGLTIIFISAAVYEVYIYKEPR